MERTDMTDRYAALRSALAAGPTPGKWEHVSANGGRENYVYSDAVYPKSKSPIKVAWMPPMNPREVQDAAYIAAVCPATIAELLKELDVTRGMVDRTLAEAQRRAQEARTANATIAEIYQVISGSTGEPGNWHGAEPVRKLVAERDALKASAWNKRDLANRLDVIARGLSANGSDAIVKHRLREIVSELGGTGVPAAIDAATEQPT